MHAANCRSLFFMPTISRVVCYGGEGGERETKSGMVSPWEKANYVFWHKELPV